MKKGLELIMAGMLTGAILISGCSNKTQNYSSSKIENKLSKYLKSNEFVLPEKVYTAYENASRLGAAYKDSSDPNTAGCCLDGHGIDHPDEFAEELSSEGYSKKEIGDYNKILSKKSNIVIRESIAVNYPESVSKEVLLHERMHRIQNNLDNSSKEKIKKMHDDVVKEVYNIKSFKDYNSLLDDKSEGSVPKKACILSWEELLPYLAMNTTKLEKGDEIKELIKDKHPEVYQILNKMEVEAE